MIDKQPKIWIDATGCFIWGNQPPTGVTRVEATILRAALDAPDIGIAFLDRGYHQYRPLRPDDMEYLKEILSGQGLSDRYRLRIQWRHFTHETARRWAAKAAGQSGRKGPVYESAKAFIRVFVFVAKLASRPFLRLRRTAARIGLLAKAGIPNGSTVLVSHVVDRKPEMRKALADGRHRAIHIVHDIIPLKRPELFNPRNSKALVAFVDMVLERHDDVITVSRATHDDLAEWLGRNRPGKPLPRMTACKLDSVGIASDGPECPIAPFKDRRFAIYCTTFDLRKNHDFLVHLWRRLYRRLGVDTPLLVLVGRDGRGTARFEAALAEAGETAAFIRTVGVVSEATLRWLYRNAAFGVYPSSQEGWGLGVSECLQFGVPVLHTDTPQLREAAHDTMPALPERDLDAWAEAVLRIA